MKKALIIFLFLFVCNSKYISAQNKVDLSIDGKVQCRTELDLRNSNGGEFLFKLPVTFQITNNNILIMLIGDDNYLPGKNSVWLFRNRQNLSELQKVNHNVDAAKKFRNKSPVLLPFFIDNENIQLYREFENNYEIITKSPKPVFFAVYDTAGLKELNLRFYVSSPGKKYPYTFMFECIPVTILINIS